MLRNLYLKTLLDQRRSLTWWSVALLAMSVFLMTLYPTVRDSAGQLNDYIQKMPDAMKALIGGMSDYATLTGYLKTELFNLMVPILLLILAVGAGSKAIAGEEERGTVDLLMANPIPRRKVLLEKFGAMVTAVVGLVVLVCLGVVIGSLVVGAHPPLVGLAAQAFSLILLALVFGSIALAVGCWRGSRGLAASATGAFAGAAYLLNALAPTVSWLAPYRRLSPFYYYSGHDPIVNGLSLGHVMVLLVAIAVFTGLAVVAFDRRDLAH